MVYSARILALLLAASIALVTALFLSLIQSVESSALLLASLISFSAAYILSYVVLEFLFFRGINKIDKMMGKLLKKELKNISHNKSEGLDPFENVLNDEIAAFALLKQKEIEELKKTGSFP